MSFRKVLSFICSFISIITLIAFFSQTVDYLDILEWLLEFDDDFAIPLLIFILLICSVIFSIPFFMCFYSDDDRQKLLRKSSKGMVSNSILLFLYLFLTEDILASLFYEIGGFFQGRFLLESFALIKKYFWIISIVSLLDSIVTYFSVKQEIAVESYQNPPAYYTEPVQQTPPPQAYGNPYYPQNQNMYYAPPNPQNQTFYANPGVNTMSANASEPEIKPILIHCPYCGFEQSRNRKVCWKCGFHLEEAPAEGASENKIRICPICGKDYTESMIFCGYCGTRLKS